MISLPSKKPPSLPLQSGVRIDDQVGKSLSTIDNTGLSYLRIRRQRGISLCPGVSLVTRAGQLLCFDRRNGNLLASTISNRSTQFERSQMVCLLSSQSSSTKTASQGCPWLSSARDGSGYRQPRMNIRPCSFRARQIKLTASSVRPSFTMTE